MFRKIKEYLLNTPEKYWIIIFGYHLHKSFWGTLLIVAGLLFGFTPAIIFGAILVILSVSGHIYTNNRPYFKFWDKYAKKNSS